jgi:hypothetical protein
MWKWEVQCHDVQYSTLDVNCMCVSKNSVCIITSRVVSCYQIRGRYMIFVVARAHNFVPSNPSPSSILLKISSHPLHQKLRICSNTLLVCRYKNIPKNNKNLQTPLPPSHNAYAFPSLIILSILHLACKII